MNPNLPEAHRALGVYYYHGFLDYENALLELAKAERGRPNDMDVLAFKSFVQRRSGRWQDAVATMKRAVDLDPRAAGHIADAALTHLYLRNFSEAERIADRALIANPDHAEAVVTRAMAMFGATGDLAATARFLRRSWERAAGKPQIPFSALDYGWPYYADSVIALAVSTLKWSPDLGDHGVLLARKAWFFWERNDLERSRAHADSAVRLLTARIRERPDDVVFYGKRGFARAILGDGRGALADSDRALSLRPVGKDALVGTDVLVDRAQALIALSRHDEAISVLEQLLAVPSLVHLNLLRLGPTYAPLRGNQRFQRLIGG